MFVRNLIAASAFVMASVSAHAAVFGPFSNLGVVGTEAAVSFGGFSRFEEATPFEISYEFSLASASGLEGFIGQAGLDFELIEPTGTEFTLSPITLEGILVDGVAASTFVAQDGGFAFTFAGLTSGTHTLTVRGVGVPEYGAFVGNVTAAIPEPTTYALLLAGLGVVGAVASRRRAA
jgi:PEP-CTERM motif